MKSKILMGLLIFIFVKINKAFCFPELVRHGYNNCIACHVSPSGGGLLTQYGRGLSNEVLSSWGSEKEAQFLNGVIDTSSVSEWIQFGGDIRAVQIHKEDAYIKKGRFIPMEASFSIGLVREQWAAVSKFGNFENRIWKPYSDTYYIMYKPREELSFRAGKFTPQYGLTISDHIAFIKSFLDLGLQSSRNTIEAQWTDEKITANISHSEKSLAGFKEQSNQTQIQYFFADKYKIAANYMSRKDNFSQKNIWGFWSILGFTQNLFWVNEFDWIKQTEKNTTVSYNKLGYTITKGLDLLLLSETLTPNKSTRAGLGFQYYPRPHIELSGAWTKQEGDYAWLLFHYYM